MTSDLCNEEVVVQITAPQIITTESVVCVPAAGVGRSAGGGGGAGGGGTAVELGRRLLLAARAGDTNLVLDLMAKGAPFTTDWLGTSPLHLAATNGHADTCGVLLRAGVSRDSRTKVERTPLHLAAYAGHAHVAALLLEHGALVDCRDMLRMTPLHWAMARGHGGAAAALLRHGADARARSKFLKTPQQLAAAAGHAELLRLVDESDAARKRREAANSVKALIADRPPDEPMEPERQQYTSIHRGTPQVKIRPKPVPEKTAKAENKAEPGRSQKSESGAAALLRRHGITLLPADDGSTVLNALQSGRTVVLSDAGKLMLKESEDGTPPASGAVTVAGAAVGAPATVGAAVGARSGRGVVLTATPVRTPPAPGVKVFTLNNRLLTAAKSDARTTRIMTQQDFQQVKFVQLPSDARVLSPRKGARRPAAPASAAARAPVKIIMNKSNFSRLLAGAQLELDAPPAAVASTPVVVTPDIPSTELPSSLLANTSTSAASPELCSLRAELACARRDAAALAEQLRECRGRLAQYEPAQ